jgi:hypothetical protein
MKTISSKTTFFSGLLITVLFALGCSAVDDNAANVKFTNTSVNKSGLPGVSFHVSSTPPTNPYPQFVAVADFNGDGILDMAVPVYSIGTSLTDVNILFGNGNGTFKAGPVFPLTGQNVNNAVVADFNGDGIPDLAISLPDAGEVQVLLGNGDGSFTLSTTISNPYVARVGTADFNGDGKPDLYITGYEVTVLLNNGNGTFTAEPSISIPGGGYSAAVGDFNGDGIPDLAVANNSGSSSGPSSVTILLGKGNGTFRQVPVSPPTGVEPLAIVAADFNGDGILDLAVTNQNDGYPNPGTITILLGKGNGTFVPMASSPETGSIPYSVAVADFNGDGIPDLATADAGSNTISVFLGKGNGTFAPGLNPPAGTDPVYAAVGDFNGDGVPDLAAADNTTSSVTVLLTQRAR